MYYYIILYKSSSLSCIVGLSESGWRDLIVQVVEGFVSGDRGNTSGGSQLVKCAAGRGWACTHDDGDRRALELVLRSPGQKIALPDVRSLPWTYMYFYGLFAHKLAHFFDVVHGEYS
jgi:hypothetical protein